MSRGVKNAFIEASGVSLGGSGVSIGGVKILRAGNFQALILQPNQGPMAFLLQDMAPESAALYEIAPWAEKKRILGLVEVVHEGI